MEQEILFTLRKYLLNIDPKFRSKKLADIKQANFKIERWYWERFVYACKLMGEDVQIVARRLIIKHTDEVLGCDGDSKQNA